jgi:hypothetical protein
MKTIDLAKFGKPHSTNKRELYFVGLELGKFAASMTPLNEAIVDGEVNVVLFNSGLERLYVDESFIKGLFGPIARKVGIKKFHARVHINGHRLIEPWPVNYYKDPF